MLAVVAVAFRDALRPQDFPTPAYTPAMVSRGEFEDVVGLNKL